MNYRHAFHAGNFADVHKHAVLVRILIHLRRKPTAFRVIDTHAGDGRYDLLGAEATQTGEWHNGIERLWKERRRKNAAQALLAPYLDAVAALNPGGQLRAYPGSPSIVLSLLRPQDRLIACEREARSAAALTAALRGDRRVKVLTIDGWTALRAYVPPKERRGLVLIDPPFEEANDFERLSEGLAAAHRKWPTGIFTLWYPIKDRRGPDALAKRLRHLNLQVVLRCELMPGPPRAEGGLAGSGLIVVNPPYTLADDLRMLLPTIGRTLSPTAASRVEWVGKPPSPMGSAGQGAASQPATPTFPHAKNVAN